MRKYQIYSAVLIITSAIFIDGCRKNIVATEQEMADYGWELFEEGDYQGSAEWFNNSIMEDSLYKDGFNGLGWSLGKLMLPDSGVTYFLEGLPLEKDRSNIHDIQKEIQAGLCFSYNAAGNDTAAIVYGAQLISAVDLEAVPSWNFSHDTTLNHLDVRLVLAVSNYSLGEFQNALSYVQEILSFIEPDAVFEADTTTAGQQAIAAEIERLQQSLQ